MRSPFLQSILRFCRTVPALSSPCKARGAPKYDAPTGGSLDGDSAKIGARQHLSMHSIGRAFGDAHAARRCLAQAFKHDFKNVSHCWGSAALLVILGSAAMMPWGAGQI